MDALRLLRRVVSKGENGAIEAEMVVIHGRRFPQDKETPYKLARGWLQLGGAVFFVQQRRENPTQKVSEYMKSCRAANVQVVSRTVWEDLMDYLTGKKDSSPNLREEEHALAGQGKASASQAEAPAAPAREVVADPEALAKQAVRHAQDQEEALITRQNVTQTPAASYAHVLTLFDTTVGHGKAKGKSSSKASSGASAAAGAPRALSEEEQRRQALRRKMLSAHDRFREQDKREYMKERLAGAEALGIDIHGSASGLADAMTEEAGAVAAEPQKRALGAASKRHSSERKRRKMERAAAASGKLTGGTPIVVVPATLTSVVSLFNARALLEEGSFVDAQQARERLFEEGSAKPAQVLIVRRLSSGERVRFRVIDNPAHLTERDWNKVVAVFTTGQAWQFRGWRWENPTELFDHVPGFNLIFSETKPSETVRRWAVRVLRLDPFKAHKCRSTMEDFWRRVEDFMVTKRAFLIQDVDVASTQRAASGGSVEAAAVATQAAEER